MIKRLTCLPVFILAAAFSPFYGCKDAPQLVSEETGGRQYDRKRHGFCEEQQRLRTVQHGFLDGKVKTGGAEMTASHKKTKKQL